MRYTISKVQIDKALVWNTRFLSHTFEMANAVQKHKMFTCIHKYYSVKIIDTGSLVVARR